MTIAPGVTPGELMESFLSERYCFESDVIIGNVTYGGVLSTGCHVSCKKYYHFPPFYHHAYLCCMHFLVKITNLGIQSTIVSIFFTFLLTYSIGVMRWIFT